VRGQPIETMRVAKPFTIVIGDTGISSPTGLAVGDVRRAWQETTSRYEALFDSAAQITRQARLAIESGRPEALGPLMDANHELLQAMGVSSVELDHLVSATRQAGALGAKLSGGGRGGNMIALSPANRAADVAQALEASGATRIIVTEIQSPPS